MGESATLRRETGTLKGIIIIKRRSARVRLWRGVSSEPNGVTRRTGGYTVLAYCASVDSESEDVYVRAVMENRPTLANACHK